MLHENQFGNLGRIHFVGIGGIGMSGIAQVLFHNGYSVSGSDLFANSITQRLSATGIHVFMGHDAAHVAHADVVVVSSAVTTDNVEVVDAHNRKVPVLTRAEMLAELMRFKFGIAVAGTHGKTTTTSLIATIFKEADLDPTYVIGGVVNSSNKNATLGSSKYLITEADESDASFVALSPMLAVVTNIDDDHMETYNNDSLLQEKIFLQFLHRLPFYARAVLCGDNDRVRNIIDRVARPITTYGYNKNNDYYVTNVKFANLTSTFTLIRSSLPPLEVKLNLPGRHNVLNALAAIAVANSCNIPDYIICRALAGFAGIARRFEVLGDYIINEKNVTVVDDYGHHPTELLATWQAARLVYRDRRIIMVFQPHRYSRTKSLWQQFTAALAKVDVVILLDIYSGGEEPIAGISSAILAECVRTVSAGEIIVASVGDLQHSLSTVVSSGDVVLFQGAGSVSKICCNLLADLIPISSL